MKDWAIVRENENDWVSHAECPEVPGFKALSGSAYRRLIQRTNAEWPKPSGGRDRVDPVPTMLLSALMAVRRPTVTERAMRAALAVPRIGSQR